MTTRKRRSPTALPPATEKQTTKAILDWLKAHRIFAWKVWQGLGSYKGVSDIIAVWPGGRIVAIEVKSSKGVLSVCQNAFLVDIRTAGGITIVARSIDDFIEQVQSITQPARADCGKWRLIKANVFGEGDEK